jgi:heme/copper-type cytochrome/quinol oxidase subunit 2
VIWATSPSQGWVPARRAVGADGVGEIAMRAYTWGFDQKIVRVNPNDLVRFRVQSEDIQHGFAINELGINLQLVPGREVRSPAVRAALPEGRYTIHCSIFCGLGHPSMKATLVVGNPGPAPASRLPWIASVLTLIAAGAFAAFLSRPSRSGA